jgi:hypothetical protein
VGGKSWGGRERKCGFSGRHGGWGISLISSDLARGIGQVGQGEQFRAHVKVKFERLGEL